VNVSVVGAILAATFVFITCVYIFVLIVEWADRRGWQHGAFLLAFAWAVASGTFVVGTFLTLYAITAP
jgi:hypothetical protein